MAVASPSPVILADPVPPVAPAPAPLRTAARKRLSLLSALIDVGCEVVSVARDGIAALVASRASDARMDADLLALRREVRRAAEESAGIHECPCWQPLMRIDALAASAQANDATEDGLVAKGLAGLTRIAEIARGMNRALTRELAKRGWTGGTR